MISLFQVYGFSATQGLKKYSFCLLYFCSAAIILHCYFYGINFMYSEEQYASRPDVFPAEAPQSEAV